MSLIQRASWLLLFAPWFFLTSCSDPPEADFKGKVIILRIGPDDLMGDREADFMIEVLDRAEAVGAEAVVLEINVPGGGYTSVALVERLATLKIPTVAFVDAAAIGWGSIVACACDEVYMAPGSMIGASAVVVADTGNEEGRVAAEMQTEVVTALSLNKNPFRVQIARCFFVLEESLVIEGMLIDSPDSLLTMTAREASLKFQGEPLLAKGVVTDLDELLQAENLEGEIVDVPISP